jgi:hypothetical protein
VALLPLELQQGTLVELAPDGSFVVSGQLSADELSLALGSAPVQEALEHLNQRLRPADEVSSQRWHFHLAGGALC